MEEMTQIDLHAECNARQIALSNRIDTMTGARDSLLRERRVMRERITEILVRAHADKVDVDYIREIAEAACVELTVEKEYSYTITGTIMVTIDILDDEEMPEKWELEADFKVEHSSDCVEVTGSDAEIREVYN